MRNGTDGYDSNGMICTIRSFRMISLTLLIIGLLAGQTMADALWTPSVVLTGMYDDNINFEGTDNAEADDYVYSLQPGLKIDYEQEVTKFSADGYAIIRRYQDNDELNDEIYRLNLNGDTRPSERFRLQGGYQFIKDTTLDSELDEIGRVYAREERTSHEARLAPSFNLTERVSIGLSGRYRDVTYESDRFYDYTNWDIQLPVNWLLETQVDTIFISPGYTDRSSDVAESKSYSLRLGWNHETTERLTMKLSAGMRYTEHEDLATRITDETWKGIGGLQLAYKFETGRFLVDFSHDLRSTADGGQVNVTRLMSSLKWNFTERVGTEIKGKYYYTQNERQNNDESSQNYQAGLELFYNLTENHIVFIAYDYSKDDEEDTTNTPSADRNQVYAGVRLNFPMI
jgi:opacity protein-like surface antigen